MLKESQSSEKALNEQSADRKAKATKTNKKRTQDLPLVSTLELLNKTWYIWRSSPLFHFSPHQASLQTYAKDLSVHLSSSLFPASSSCFVKCSVTILKEEHPINTEDDDDEEFHQPFIGITASVHDRDHPNQKGKECLVVLSPRAKDASIIDFGEGFMAYPVVFIKGPNLIAKHIRDWFRTRFDCHMSQLILNSNNLLDLFKLWSSQLVNSSGKGMELTYKSGSTDLATVNIQIPYDDTLSLAKSVLKLSKEHFGTNLLQAISEHYFHHFRIHLSALSLSRFGTNVAFLDHEGRIKVFEKDYLDLVLLDLCANALP